jgi:SAM-dependent methyltransferase
MNPDEFDALARIEEKHWFYSGKREIVRRWLTRVAPSCDGGILVDVGAGTGLFAVEMQQRYRVTAVDPDSNALRLLQNRANLPTIAASANDLPFRSGSVTAVTALDVIEHIDDDRGAVTEFTRIVVPNGIIILTVPALPSLWSEWDVALHHYRRYTRDSLRCVLAGLPVEICYLNYMNTFALAPIWAYRTARRVGFRPSGNRLEDRVPPEPINGLLRKLFVSPALWNVPMPAGVSLIAVLRRK